MKLEVKIFPCRSSEYEKAKELRYNVLRKPLRIEFTEEELKKDEHDIHFGLFEGEKILACLILTKHENGKIKMRQVAVDKNFQAKGLGKKLSLAAEDYARENGFNLMFCHARKTAVPFYQKLGYKIASDEFTEVNMPHYRMEKQL